MNMAKEDIRVKDKPEFCGGVVCSTKFITSGGLVVKEIKGKIESAINGKELSKYSKKSPCIIKIKGTIYKIKDVVDRSEGFRITREFVLETPTEDEIIDSKPEVCI